MYICKFEKKRTYEMFEKAYYSYSNKDIGFMFIRSSWRLRCKQLYTIIFNWLDNIPDKKEWNIYLYW